MLNQLGVFVANADAAVRSVSPFEILMLVCFGAAWPLSIWKSWRARETGGKSLLFLYVVFIGYVSGTLHKMVYRLDNVIFLYILNGIMVAVDIALYYRNRAIERALAKADPADNPDTTVDTPDKPNTET